MSFRFFITSKLFYRHLLILVFSFGLILFLILYSLSAITKHNQRIEVPDLTYTDISEAKTLLAKKKLRLYLIDSSSYNTDFPKKSVIEQNPEPGEFVKENRKIFVKVNKSDFQKVSLPRVTQISKRNAMAILKASGLKVEDQPIYVYDIAKDVVRGVIYNGEELKPGTPISRNSELQLILGDGKAAKNYKSEIDDHSF